MANSFHHVCIMGDFNCPDIDWNLFSSHTGISNNFLSLCYEIPLYQFVSLPTRGNNILDLVLASSQDIIENVELHPPPGFSDHNMISFSLTNIFHHQTVENTIRYDFFKADYSLINSFL